MKRDEELHHHLSLVLDRLQSLDMILRKEAKRSFHHRWRRYYGFTPELCEPLDERCSPMDLKEHFLSFDQYEGLLIGLRFTPPALDAAISEQVCEDTDILALHIRRMICSLLDAWHADPLSTEMKCAYILRHLDRLLIAVRQHIDHYFTNLNNGGNVH